MAVCRAAFTCKAAFAKAHANPIMIRNLFATFYPYIKVPTDVRSTMLLMRQLAEGAPWVNCNRHINSRGTSIGVYLDGVAINRDWPHPSTRVFHPLNGCFGQDTRFDRKWNEEREARIAIAHTETMELARLGGFNSHEAYVTLQAKISTIQWEIARERETVECNFFSDTDAGWVRALCCHEHSFNGFSDRSCTLAVLDTSVNRNIGFNPLLTTAGIHRTTPMRIRFLQNSDKPYRHFMYTANYKTEEYYKLCDIPGVYNADYTTSFDRPASIFYIYETTHVIVVNFSDLKDVQVRLWPIVMRGDFEKCKPDDVYINGRLLLATHHCSITCDNHATAIFTADFSAVTSNGEVLMHSYEFNTPLAVCKNIAGSNCVVLITGSLAMEAKSYGRYIFPYYISRPMPWENNRYDSLQKKIGL
jgi:hypothetical protein